MALMESGEQDEKGWSLEIWQSSNYPGLASLVCGSLALLLASIPYLDLLTLPLSVAGLVLGSLGVAAFFRKREGLVFPAAGIAVSLTAFCLFTLGLFWDRTEESSDSGQKLIPLRGSVNLSAAVNPESEWVDADKDAVQQGDIRVRFVSATVQAVELKEPSGKKRRGDKCLIIKLRISNAGAGRLIQYSGWLPASSADIAANPLVYDPDGKTYQVKPFEPGGEVVGHVSRAALPPGKWVEDVLLFEAVPPGVKFLRLELPWQALGEQGKIRLQISGRLIAFKASR